MFCIQIGSRDGRRVFRKRKGRGWSNRNFSVAVQLRRSNIHTTGSYSEASVRLLRIPILPAADMKQDLKVVQSRQIRLSSHYFTNLIKTIYSFHLVQGDSLARGPKQIWEKYSRIWRNAFKCAWM